MAGPVRLFSGTFSEAGSIYGVLVFCFFFDHTILWTLKPDGMLLYHSYLVIVFLFRSKVMMNKRLYLSPNFKNLLNTTFPLLKTIIIMIYISVVQKCWQKNSSKVFLWVMKSCYIILTS